MLLAPDSSGVIAVQPVRSVAPSAAVVVDADAMMCGGRTYWYLPMELS